MDNRNEEELFITIIDKFLNDYGYTVQSPHGDTYIEFYNRQGNKVGGFNYSGHNFFACLEMFVNQILVPSGKLR